MTPFDRALFMEEGRRRGLVLGREVSWRDETESTNDDATAAARAGAVHGTVFGAEAQTRGRGRRGSAWVSSPGQGLWFSVLLRPQLDAERVAGLALCAGLAVRAAVAPRVTAQVGVKWPNDVLANERKLAGILTESQLSGSKITSVIVGIGINVEQTAFPEPISGIATSLSLLGASDRGREALLVDVLAHLELQISNLATEGLPAIARELAPFDALRGRALRVDALEGSGAGVDAEGRLLVQSSDGRVTPVLSGHVQLL
jgi:BirA family transcriptional regulator, biotin operon repressor / biotin---[acetyl-CoA-carboxylase] ligase